MKEPIVVTAGSANKVRMRLTDYIRRTPYFGSSTSTDSTCPG